MIDDEFALRQRVADLEAQVQELLQRVADSTASHPRLPPPGPATSAQWSRRALILGGAAAAVGGVAGLGAASPAAAAVGTMLFGAKNDAGSSGTSLTSASSSPTLAVTNNGVGSGIPAHAISAQAASPSAAAVNAVGQGTTAVRAESTGARSVVAGAVVALGKDACGVVAQSETGAPLRVANTSLSAVPTTGAWTQGDFVSVNGSLWFCVSSGSPGQWRLLTSPAAAGAFVPIVSARVYDTRTNTAPGATTPAPLKAGSSRAFSVANAYNPSTATVSTANVVPVGARAVSITLTATKPTGAGSLFVAPGNTNAANSANLYWSAANQTVATSLIVGLDTARQLKAFLVMPGASSSSAADFFVDVNGYFLGR